MPNKYLIRGKDLDYVRASHEDPADPGALKKILIAAGVIPAGRVMMVNLAWTPVGRGFNAHHHEDMTEVFVFTGGSGYMKVAGCGFVVGPEDCVVVPPETVHELENTGTGDIRYLVFGVAHGTGGRTLRSPKKAPHKGGA